MAKLMLIGNVARIELTPDDEDDQVVHAKCAEHLTDGWPMPCPWAKQYDSIAEAAQYAADHADRGQ